MDSGNLAIIMAAVFVRSDNAKEDAAMCRASGTTSNPAEHTQTLAGILKVAIENYDGIFPKSVEAQSGSPIERHSPKLEGHTRVSALAAMYVLPRLMRTTVPP